PGPDREILLPGAELTVPPFKRLSFSLDLILSRPQPLPLGLQLLSLRPNVGLGRHLERHCFFFRRQQHFLAARLRLSYASRNLGLRRCRARQGPTPRQEDPTSGSQRGRQEPDEKR